MTAPFQPVGTEARWRTVYGLLRHRNVGDVITYETMGKALNVDPREGLHVIRGAVPRAAREYEEVDQHALAPVRNVGYRVVEASEHMGLAKIHQRKSSRALRRSQSKVVHVDWNALTPEAQRVFAAAGQLLALQMDFNRRMDIRQKRLEEAVSTIAVRTDRSETEVAELRERLEKLEARS